MRVGINILRISLLSLTVLCYVGCSDDSISPDTPQAKDIYQSPTVPQGQITIIGHNVHPVPYLGVGYDIMGDYLSASSAKESILDLNKIPKEHISIIPTPVGYANHFQGHNVREFLQSVMGKEKFSAPTGNENDLLFTGTINSHDYFTTPYDYSTQYSFVCEQLIISKVHHFLNTKRAEILIPYLTDDFKRALNLFTPEQLIEAYGTHVLTSVVLGSRIKTIYRTVIADQGDNALSAAHEGLGARRETICEIYGDNMKYPEKEVAKNNGGTIIVEFHGGNQKMLPHIILTPNEVIGKPMDISKWKASNNDSNYALTSLSGSDMIPIYELIADPVKQQKVKEAFGAYIKAKQLTELQTVSLFQAWNGKHHRYFTSYKDLVDNTDDTYDCHGVIGSLFVLQEPGTVPLHLYSNKQNDRLTLNYPTNMEGMEYMGIIGYVYGKYSNDLDCIYEIWNGEDYAYTTENKKSYGEKESWKQTGNEFYTKKISL